MTLRDKFGRAITDLRISVTDRCNFRCVYCRSADPENYVVMTGYGLSRDGIWRPHSWCVDRKTGKIIETTERRTKYFGVEFSEHEVKDLQDAADPEPPA